MSFQPKSDFLDIMMSRGFLADCTDYEGLDKALLAGGMPGYIGFDATAQSLHVGSLIQIMMLRWLQKTGGRPPRLTKISPASKMRFLLISHMVMGLPMR